ncbi:MAG TPA: GtrA family protein [Candidatus Acidoferrales bacterium]|nr:GtrA family protein [Candidatus Acidoferrales bacterium]
MKSRLAQVLEKLPWRSLARWWIVGVAFLAVGTVFLYVAKDVLHMPVILATPVSAEVTLLVRFLINDSWVFGHQRPTWKRLWQFHVASAGGFAIWMVVTNGLYQLGVHYLIASVIGSACSMFFSIATNFLWIWRHRAAGAAACGVD